MQTVDSRPVNETIRSFLALQERRTFEVVAERIRVMVSDGLLKPGDRLPPERDLAATMRVSRSGVREALRTLEVAGIVELRPGRAGGAFVRAANSKNVSDEVGDLLRLGNLSWKDLTEARILLMEVIVRRAAVRATAADIKALDECMQITEDLYDKGLVQGRPDVLFQFHRVLATAAHNPYLSMMNDIIIDMLQYFARRLGAQNTRKAFLSRRRFMAAFKAGDFDGAWKELSFNMKSLHRIYIKFAREAKERSGTP